MNSQKQIVGLGEVLWDLYPEEKHLGGSPANAAIHAHRLGAEGVIVSAVGQDDLGDAIMRSLGAQGINTHHIQRSPSRPTGTVRVRLDQNGIPQFRCSKDVAFDDLRWNENLDTLLKTANAIVIGTLAQRNPTSRETIQNAIKIASGTIVFDVNFREWNDGIGQIVKDTLIHTDILKVNENELHALKKAFSSQKKSMFTFLEWLMDTFPMKLIAVSLGKKGCLLTNGNETVLSPGINIPPVDTTGCGDAFVAGMAFKYLKNATLEEMAEFANQLGAFIATMKGAAPEYTVSDFMNFQNNRHDRNRFQL